MKSSDQLIRLYPIYNRKNTKAASPPGKFLHLFPVSCRGNARSLSPASADGTGDANNDLVGSWNTSNRRGVIARNLAPILDRPAINSDGWIETAFRFVDV
jgi:hypothetical protein